MKKAVKGVFSWKRLMSSSLSLQHEPPGNFGLLNGGNGPGPVQPANENAPPPIEGPNDNVEMLEDHAPHQEVPPLPPNPNIAEGDQPCANKTPKCCPNYTAKSITSLKIH